MSNYNGYFYSNVCEFTPPIYYLASLASGKIAIEDTKPSEMSSWRRLRQYLKDSGDSVTRLRIATPHQLIDCGEKTSGKSYSILFRLNRFQKAIHDLNNELLNQESLIYAVLKEDEKFDVWTIFSTENYKHVGFHRAFVKEWMPPDSSEDEKNKSITLTDIGILINN